MARGTRIRTPGGQRPVEDIAVGDEVCCVDPDTGSVIGARVSAIRSAQRECVEVGFGAGKLVLTSDHPLFYPVTGQWAPAGDWALGRRTQLLRVEAEAVTPVVVDRTSTFAGVHQVFDLSVDHPLHNFVAGGVLVHNKSPPREPCLEETVNLRAETDCGPVANLAITSNLYCDLSVDGGAAGGLPSAGQVTPARDVSGGFTLEGIATDAGYPRLCRSSPSDGGFAISCAPRCPSVECDGGRDTNCTVTTGADGGSQTTCVRVCSVTDCDVSCSGILIRQK